MRLASQAVQSVLEQSLQRIGELEKEKAKTYQTEENEDHAVHHIRLAVVADILHGCRQSG